MFLILETVFSKSFGANQKLCFSRNRERRALTVKTVWFAVLALLVTFLVLSVPSVMAVAPQSPAFASTPRAQTTYTYYLPFLANRYVMSGTTGSYTTYLAIQNTSSATANITVAYYASNGNVLATPPTNCVAINPLAECVASNPFAMGKRGTGVVTSDQPLSIEERNLSTERAGFLYDFIDSIVQIPEDLEEEFYFETTNKEQNMPFITTVERVVERRALAQGREEGRQEGQQTQALAMVLRQLKRRLGELSADLETRIGQLDLAELEALLDFHSAEDLAQWLQVH